MIKIVKVGGRLIEDQTALSYLCEELAGYYPGCILIHGGGSMAGQLLSRLEIPVRMHEGRRITDEATLEVAIMAYAGLANKKIVAMLQSKGVNACGLSGCDMGVVRAHKRPVKEIDWGLVGDIDRIGVEALMLLLQQQVLPVLSPITLEDEGQLLNTNADGVASAVAMAVSRKYETELVFCLDKPGVLREVNDPESVISELTPEQYRYYREQRIIHSGMVPKLEYAFQALEAGVKLVRLTDPLHFSGGTIVRKVPEGIES